LFEVRFAASAQAVDKIGAGQTIGEMGFFSGERRTAFVIAARDSEVLELDKASFEELVRRHPGTQSAIIKSMAKRLVAMANDRTSPNRMTRMRMVAIISGGVGGISTPLDGRLRKTMVSNRICIVTSADARSLFGNGGLDAFAIANWLTTLERRNDLVVCITDDSLTDWTKAAIRCADQLVILAEGEGTALNPVEKFAFELLPPARRRLVRLQQCRSGISDATEPWVHHRDVFLVHHVALEDDQDFQSLRRFLAGEAIGLVAGGGRAFGPAHVGIYKALCERGFVFDIFGGTSVDSAMAAAFSLQMEPHAIEAAVHEIFVKSRAFKRLIIPKYSLLDHTVFDQALQRIYGATPIQDVWNPFFAVATDLSDSAMRVIRTGPRPFEKGAPMAMSRRLPTQIANLTLSVQSTS
jgi:NTE family protein